MYEDSWYNFVPDVAHKKNTSISQTSGTPRRKESLLQPTNNGANQADTIEPLENLYELPEPVNEPPEPHLTRRAKSYSDFYNYVRPSQSRDVRTGLGRREKRSRQLDALIVEKAEGKPRASPTESLGAPSLEDRLLEASQQEYLCYLDQLSVTGRHLDRLIEDTDRALDLLGTLAGFFQSVDAQTSLFEARCDHLLIEERRLQKLADEVGTDLHYYAYLDGVTRRLNAPGASRLVDHENFTEILINTDACICFMINHPTYRDAESYLARYQSCLTKALHLLEAGFTQHLDKISTEISKQIASTQSKAAHHALAYGRFEELVLDADGLIINVQKVVRNCYDELGNPVAGPNFDYYSNIANNIFASFCDYRDRDLRPITQMDLETFKKEVKEGSTETASRNFIKQCYERSHHEENLFVKIFSIYPQFSIDDRSSYAALKSQYPRSLVTAANVDPIANTLQSCLQSADLQTICNILGWITNEYLLLEYDEVETRYTQHCQELSARLLIDHLWPFADTAFENEITKSIVRQPVSSDSLKIIPVINGVASSNAHPITKRALELLIMYDQAMPKERSQRSSSVIFRIVNETISALQRVETRLKSTKSTTPEPDPDLFMIKNLLILKNELVSLEIGDIRSEAAAMQHFGQIWDTLSPQNWMGLFRGILGGSLSLGLWSRVSGVVNEKPATTTVTAKDQVQDASEKLDELLRQSIYTFTQRWGSLINAAQTGKRSTKSLSVIEKELEEKLYTAFGGQPEVVAKLKEAIQINAQAQKEVGVTKGSR